MADTLLSSYPDRVLTHVLGHDASDLVGKLAVAGLGGGATVLVSDTAPDTITTPVNSLWWESDTGIMYILYDDTSSIQWVAVGESVSGDVLGPPSSTDDHVVLFDGATGKYIKDSGIAIGDIGGGSIAPLQLTDANTVEQYNGATAQSFSVYNERTDASNYERAVFDWTLTSDVLTIGTQKSGVGMTLRPISLIGSKIGAGAIGFTPAAALHVVGPAGNTSYAAVGDETIMLSNNDNAALTVACHTIGYSMIRLTNATTTEASRILFYALDTSLSFGTAGTDRWQFTSAGHFKPIADAVYDIGASANRIRSVYARTKAGAPVAGDIPDGTFMVIRDTSGATTKLYYNNGGTLMSVALT